MGILSNLTEGGSGGQSPGSGQSNATYRENIINEAQRAFDEEHSNYHQLGSMLESEDRAVQYRAATTLKVMENQRKFLENMETMYGEAVVTAGLGALNRRTMDVVRIFYPNQIAQDLVDIQPLDGEVGQIFTMTPRFSQPLGNISAGDEVFRTFPNNNNYASERLISDLGTGDASATTFAVTLDQTPIRKSTVKILEGTTEIATDNGSGTISGDKLSAGTINYETGVVSITYSEAPAAAVDINIEYLYSSEINESGIRQLEFDLSLTPIKARQHPILMKFSVAAGLAAQAHLAIDVQDTVSELGGQFIKNERDERLIKLIDSNANTDTSLNFDAQRDTEYTIKQKYAEIELKLDQAEALIQGANGRGSVDWVLCGRNAANVFRHSSGFRDEDVQAPIGAHRIGSLRDGTVTVIKSLTLNTNTFIFGYKGYMPGDSATILAEWIPMYFTPVQQNPTLTNAQGVMSMYDLFVNKASYYYKGTVSNYSA